MWIRQSEKVFLSFDRKFVSRMLNPYKSEEARLMNTPVRLSALSRRDFLKGIMQVSLTGLAAVTLPQILMGIKLDAPSANTQVDVLGRKLRGTFDGLILESVDGGNTWQRIANFGNHCSVWTIHEHQGQIYARIGVKGYQFTLRSTDARKWHTI